MLSRSEIKVINMENEKALLLKRNGILVNKKFTEFFFPSVLMSASISLSIIIDAVIVGNVLGNDELAVMNLIMPLTLCFTAISGLGLVACSSGKHKGETKISHRGRKRLRYWLFQGAKSAVAHAGEFKELHDYYTTRPDNPLKKMQSLIVIACKLLRVIYTILRTGTKYDPKKLLSDIKRQEKQTVVAA